MWFKMTLTPSDVASLTATLTYWEYAEYASGAFVALACVGEYIASFKPWFTGGNKERKERLEKRSTLLLIVALAAELICLVRTNQISGQVIGALDTKAAEAYRKSGLATTNSDSAARKAKAASDEADAAKIESGKARDAASVAELVARGARQEADSFEKEISKAQSDLTALKRRMADRHITPEQGTKLRKWLEAFPNKGVQITLVNSDSEVQGFANDLSDALAKLPGWVVAVDEIQTPGGRPSVAVVMESAATKADNLFADSLTFAIRSVGQEVAGPMPIMRGATVVAGGAGELHHAGTLNPRQNVNIEIGKKP
jgi:hypothetical protein